RRCSVRQLNGGCTAAALACRVAGRIKRRSRIVLRPHPPRAMEKPVSRCSAASRRRLLSSMLLLIGLLAAAAPRLRLAVPATAQTSLPDAVAALLPAGAQIQDAQAADFTNAGEQGWAVLYATPTDIPGATA